MEHKLIKDINAKWKDYRIGKRGQLNESVGNYLHGVFEGLIEDTNGLVDSSTISPDAAKKLVKAANILYKTYKIALKGKGLKGW